MKREIPAGRAVPADWLSNFDRYLISEGTHERAYEKLGAHLARFDGVDGVVFAVWAPNARQVAVVGDFNDWHSSLHPMHSSNAGIWTLFIPGLSEFCVYKYRITAQNHEQFDKADPFGFAMEERPRTGPPRLRRKRLDKGPRAGRAATSWDEWSSPGTWRP